MTCLSVKLCQTKNSTNCCTVGIGDTSPGYTIRRHNVCGDLLASIDRTDPEDTIETQVTSSDWNNFCLEYVHVETTNGLLLQTNYHTDIFWPRYTRSKTLEGKLNVL